jgi:hypothetical protein
MTVDQIIKEYGSPTRAKNALGFTLQTFRNWRRNGIPLRSQQVIQYITSGKLKAGSKK